MEETTNDFFRTSSIATLFANSLPIAPNPIMSIPNDKWCPLQSKNPRIYYDGDEPGRLKSSKGGFGKFLPIETAIRSEASENMKIIGSKRETPRRPAKGTKKSINPIGRAIAK